MAGLVSDAAEWMRALDADERAFGELFARHHHRVFRHALHLVAVPTEADEVMTAAFFELWRRRSSVHLVDGSVLPWLLVTATNVANNVRRSGRRYQALLDRLPPVRPARAADVEDESDVVAAMRRLSLADQQVLTLCVMEGLSEREAAEALQIAPGTVKSRLHRAKRRLAQRVQAPIGVTPGRGVRDGV